MAQLGSCVHHLGLVPLLLTVVVMVMSPWSWQFCHCQPTPTPQNNQQQQQQQQQPEVSLGDDHQTVVTGVRTSLLRSGQAVLRFLGLRYGRAPVGTLRFKPPQPVGLPRRRVDAKVYGSRCPQGPSLRAGMSEDCLYLNVFVPEASSDAALLPVFVWFHGGGFIVGSSTEYEAEELSGEGGVVVVTLNYRLGPLGFLSTGDASAPGNYGLQDQRLALRWVQDHIHRFGGDKARVTLAGVSAGAASASLHALSPLSRGLFRHVIQLSGSATSPWARVSSAAALESARALGRSVGCLSYSGERNASSSNNSSSNSNNSNSTNYGSTQSLVTCLRVQPLENIMAASVVLFPQQVGRSVVDFVWAPVADGRHVVGVDRATLFPGPLMAGLVSNEGDTLFSWTVPRVAGGIPPVQALLRERQFFRRHFLPALLKQTYPGLVPLPWTSFHRGQQQEGKDHNYEHLPFVEALQRLQCAYEGRVQEEEGKTEGEGSLPEMSEEVLRTAYGDQGFLQGTVGFLQRFCDQRHRRLPCFLYFADYQTKRPGITGIRHLDDVIYLFGFNTTLSRLLSGYDGHVTNLDLRLARDMRQLFLNFIKTGDPNAPQTPAGWPRPWTPFTAKGAHYMHVSPSPSVLSRLRADKMALWLEEAPRILTKSAEGNSSNNSNSAVDRSWRCRGQASSSGHGIGLPRVGFRNKGNAVAALVLLILLWIVHV